MRLRDLRDRRNTLVATARAILEKAESEKRDLTPEEQTNYDKAFADQNALRGDIERFERQEQLDKELREKDGGGRGRSTNGAPTPEARAFDRDTLNPKYRIRAGQFAGYERADEMDAEMSRRGTPEYEGAFRNYIATGEKRSLDASSGPAGAYTVVPIQFAQDFLQAVNDQCFIRELATVDLVPKAEALGIMTLDTDPSDFDWTPELGTGNEDTSMAFGRREMRPHPLAKRLKVSNKLLRASLLNVDAKVIERLAYKVAITEEKAFQVGDGIGKPLGIFTASADGIPTSRDIATDNTSTAITMDGLISAKYGLKAQYQRKARWLFHRDGITMISKLKASGTGQYLWEPSKKIGEPDTLLGIPTMQSEYTPNTFTTGKYVGVIGDFSFFRIVDALDMTIQRLDQLYAETNQMGFICRRETDGQPVMAEAFARVKLG